MQTGGRFRSGWGIVGWMPLASGARLGPYEILAPIGAGKLQLGGEPTPVAEPIWRHASFSASHTGILAYRSGGIQSHQIEWRDRQGNSFGAVGPPGNYEDP